MKIAVIGCGWLGLPLAQKLVKEGHSVYGSTTNSEKLQILADSDILPFIYSDQKNKILPDWSKELEVVIINFPPSKSADYSQQIAHLVNQLSPSCKLIFTSSTSVYVDIEGNVDENSLLNNSHPVTRAEEIIKNSANPSIILRLAGLIGGDRHPVKFMSGKKYPDGNMSVNLVQRADVLNAILKVLSSNSWNSIYNVCWDAHPSKAEYYCKKAKEFSIQEPNFTFSDKKGKIVDGTKIATELDFQYSFSI
jgi:nucleoside-diphosphate-sugar epimerase